MVDICMRIVKNAARIIDLFAKLAIQTVLAYTKNCVRTVQLIRFVLFVVAKIAYAAIPVGIADVFAAKKEKDYQNQIIAIRALVIFVVF